MIEKGVAKNGKLLEVHRLDTLKEVGLEMAKILNFGVHQSWHSKGKTLDKENERGEDDKMMSGFGDLIAGLKK